MTTPEIAKTTSTRPPDKRGAGEWCAWRAVLMRVRPAQSAGVSSWLLYCPGAHVCWSYWWISLCHLRPIEGVEAVQLHAPDMRYEVICYAQDPEHGPDPDRPAETSHMLSPIDWGVQFGSVDTDEKAARVIELVVDAIMTGHYSPDSDFRSLWQASIPATAKHVAEGKHLPS